MLQVARRRRNLDTYEKLKARLGDKNQEHCTVYNMIRLAEFLFRQTKDPAYMHYIEYNVQNGIMAQTYCPEGGLLTYFCR